MPGRRRRRYLVALLRAASRQRLPPKVAIIGAGFGGLATAVALRRAGIDDLVIIECADGVGGTWRQNKYPGAACDVKSHLYSLSFAPNREWSRTFANQPEILAYLESVADDFDLRRHLVVHTRVRRAVWNSGQLKWELDLDSTYPLTPDALAVDVVVSAVGLFGAPHLPNIAGLDDFAGPVLHTSRWNPDVELAGRRVAVIGTGASGIQVIPEVAKTASAVTVFQRTPPWMLPKDDRPHSPDELARFRSRPWAARLERWRLWKEQHVNTALMADDPRIAERQLMAKLYLDRKVADPQLRDALTPDYPFGCKRVLLGGKFYAAVQQDHVALVSSPIRRITSGSIVTDAAEIDVDAIVLATGFETTRYLSGIEVVGAAGQTLHERWGEDPQAYLGVAVSGFPNFFMLYGPNTNQGGNSIIYILEAGARLVASAVVRLARRGGHLEVRPATEDRFNRQLAADLRKSVWAQCSSYFRAPDGRIVTQWPYTGLEYAKSTWRLRPRDWIHQDTRMPAETHRLTTLAVGD